MPTLDHIVRRNTEVVQRVMRNAQGFVVCKNSVKNAIMTSFDGSTAQGIVKQICGTLVYLARAAVRDLDPTNDLTFLRVQTKKFEYLVAPEKEFTIVVVQ